MFGGKEKIPTPEHLMLEIGQNNPTSWEWQEEWALATDAGHQLSAEVPVAEELADVGPRSRRRVTRLSSTSSSPVPPAFLV